MIGTKRLPSCLSGEAPEGYESNKRSVVEGIDCVKTGATRETDTVKIQSRLKQIQFGKNTTGYDNYVAAVPKRKRTMPIDKHPRTPDPYEIQSKRQFDGKIKVWRRGLHLWDNHGDAAFTSSSSGVPVGSLDAIVNESKKRLELTSKPSLPCAGTAAAAADIQQYDGYDGEDMVGASFRSSSVHHGTQEIVGQGGMDPNQKLSGNDGDENDMTTHMDVTIPTTSDVFCEGKAGGKEMSTTMNVLGDAVEVLRAVGNDHSGDGGGDGDDDDDDVL